MQGVQVNGRSQQRRCPSTRAASPTGGTIDFEMGPNPSSWGSGTNDAPPSLTKGDEAPKPLQDATGPGLGTATATGGQDAAKLFDDTSSTQLTFTAGDAAVTWALPRRQAGADVLHRHLRGERGRPVGVAAGGLQRRASPGPPSTPAAAQAFPWRKQTRPFKIEQTGTVRAVPPRRDEDGRRRAAEPRRDRAARRRRRPARWRRHHGHRREQRARDVGRHGIRAAGHRHRGHRQRLPGHDRLG